MCLIARGAHLQALTERGLRVRTVTGDASQQGQWVMAFSMSMEEIHSPPLLMTSLSRSVSLR
jgi:hypothetical protein